MIGLNEYQQKALATAAVKQKNRAGKAWSGLGLASALPFLRRSERPYRGENGD